MSNFALDTSSSQGDLVSSLNYALANLGTFDANAVANIATIVVENILSNANIISNVLSNANVVTANTTTGALSSVHTGTINYLYNYVNVKYANSATGGSGFSSNSANKSYYGVHNTKDGSISNNPVDYQWFQVVGGFGTTRGLYHTTAGGGLVYFEPSTTAPSIYYTPVVDDQPIALQSLANSIVVTNTINPGAVTNVGIATQTITTNNMAFGIITADLLAANLIIAKDIVSTNATLGNTSSTGYWLQANSGSARFGGNVSIGNNLTIGNNAVIGGNLSIGNNLTVGSSTVIGNNLTIGNNAVIGGNLSIGNNLTVGSSTVIGNNLTIGNNAVIGGNLTVAGLITSANLNANTVQTVTMVPNSATLTSGYQGAAYEIASPIVAYAGFDGTYYDYQTANIVIPAVGIACTTANVTNVVSGYIDVYGVTTSTVNFIPQMYAELYRVIGANATPLPGTFITTAAYNILAPGSDYTTQSEFPIRISEVSIIDIFTITPPQTVEYFWVFGSFVGVTSNTAPTQNYIGQNGWSMTVTNYRR